MKKRFILLLFLIIPFSTLLKSQDQTRAVLDEVSTQLLDYSSLQADFTFSLINEEADLSESFSGSLVMQGKKFRLSLMGMLAQCNGEKMWNYSEELNEASIVDPDESEFFNPVNIFTLYKQDFKLKTLSTQASIYTIELIPTKEDEEYSRIILVVDKAKKLIREVTYFGSDGNKYVIKISNVIPNVQVDDRFFNFDPAKYPGVSVYDMR